MTERQCMGCGQAFEAPRSWSGFHSAACRRAFHRRNAARGQVLLPLAQAWRAGKHGANVEQARWAFRQMCALLDAWNEEDRKDHRSPALACAAKERVGWMAADYLAP